MNGDRARTFPGIFPASSSDPSRLAVGLLVVFSLLLVAGIALAAFDRLRVRRAVIAAGAPEGESYVLAAALVQVAERTYPNLRLELRATAGTDENLRLLESGEVQLATAQADVPVGPHAQAVAHLFADHFQLLVRPDRTVRSFADLKGRRIALPRRGGQYRSFVDIADHYGLKATDFIFIGVNEEDANARFRRGEADAAFRVRALGNPSLVGLAGDGRAELLAIAQGAAMQLRHPAFEPAVIPQGTYRGDPPLPEADLATVKVDRTLLARTDADPEAVRMLTEILHAHRHALAEAIPEDFAEVRPLLATIRRPPVENGLGPPLHPGAVAYYDRDQPSFVQQNADYLALLLTVLLLVWSWIAQFARRLERGRKDAADAYSRETVALLKQARTSQDPAHLEQLSDRLLGLLTEAVADLDREAIPEESFQSFRGLWEIANGVVRERRSLLRERGAEDPRPPSL
jgi:hypothetical protein